MGAQESTQSKNALSGDLMGLGGCCDMRGATNTRTTSHATAATPQTAPKLFQLARSGNVKGLHALDQKCTHLPLDARNAEGETLLHVAARYGHTDFAGELLRREVAAQPNRHGDLPKDVALLGGYAECAALFSPAPVTDEEEDSDNDLHSKKTRGATKHQELYTGDDSHPALRGNPLGIGFAVILDGKPGKSLFERVDIAPHLPFPPDLRSEIIMEYHEQFKVYGVRLDGWCLVGRVHKDNLHLHQEGWVPGQQRPPRVNPCPLRPSPRLLALASDLLLFA